MPPKKRILTDDEIDQVERLAPVLRLADIADFLGMHEVTLHKKMRADPRVRQAYKRGKARAIAGVGSSLLQQARDGNLTAMIFYLKTQGRWRETWRIENLDLSALSDDDLATIIRDEDE
jgi:hypothetical protein